MVAFMHNKLPDTSPVFARYATLMREADAVFARVREQHDSCVTCHEGCSDCCHALFDLSLVEAAYLHDAFVRAFPVGPDRSALLERADGADRKIHSLKRKAFKAAKDGGDTDAILANLAAKRVRCPLLDENNRCALYAARPVTCRVYGIPTDIAGKAHVCGRSRFQPGASYPTVHLDAIRHRLSVLSLDLSHQVGSGFAQIHTVLVPVSMALLTEYDAAYFGLDKKRGAPSNG